MRIQVKSEDNNIDITIPTGFVFSRPVVWAWLKMSKLAAKRSVSQYVPDSAEFTYGLGLSMDRYSDEAVYAFCDELMRIKRKYGAWDLVEVESAEGDQILIRL